MKRKSIRKSFNIRFMIILATLLVLACSVMYTVQRLQNSRRYTKSITDVISTLEKSQAAHFKWLLNLSEAIDGNAEFTGTLDATQCTLGKHIYSDAVKNNPDVSDTVAAIEPLHKEIHTRAGEILAISNNTEARRQYEADIKPKVEQLSKLLDDAIANREAMIVEQDSKVMFDTVANGIFLVFCLIICLIACATMYAYVQKNLCSPILHITQVAKQLAVGKLNLDFTVKTENEIGELGDVLNSSTQEISKYVHDIDRAMGEFANRNFNVVPAQPFVGDFKRIENSIVNFIRRMCGTLSTMQNSADMVSSGAEQIADGAQLLSQGATEQACSVEQLVRTVNDITTHISATAENSDIANQLVAQTGDKVTTCNTQMNDMIIAMTEISSKSGEIGKIIKTIEDIAFQTNILALNAAVEAARAGSAGKGFAVVADEVRNLAGKSAEAAKNTTQLIEDTINAVENGESVAKLAAATLSEVVEGAMAITGRVEEIAQAAKQQAEAAKQISLNIEQISSVVQNNSATSEESAAASEELSSQARLLDEAVGEFTLADAAIMQ